MAIYYKIYKIYKITNCINNKSYIGVTGGKLKDRYYRHLLDSKYNAKLPLHVDINKYGADNFSIEILDYIIHHSLPTCTEGKYIEKYNTVIPNGYNNFFCYWEGGK